MESTPPYDDGITEEMMLDALRKMGYPEDWLKWALEHIDRKDWPEFIKTELDKEHDEIAAEYPDVRSYDH